MFTNLIALANTYFEAKKVCALTLAQTDKEATPKSSLHTKLLFDRGMVGKINKEFTTSGDFEWSCWDCGLDPDAVANAAKWMRRHGIEKLTMSQWSRLLYATM